MRKLKKVLRFLIRENLSQEDPEAVKITEERAEVQDQELEAGQEEAAQEEAEEEDPSLFSEPDPATTDHRTLLLYLEPDHQPPPFATATTSAEANAAERTEESESSQRLSLDTTDTIENLRNLESTNLSGMVLQPLTTPEALESRDGIQDPEFANPEGDSAEDIEY